MKTRRLYTFFSFVLILLLATALPAFAQDESDGYYSIPDCIRQALSTNPEIQQYVHNLRAADEDLNSAKGQFLPSLDANGEWGVGNTNSKSRRTAGTNDIVQDRGTYGLTLTQKIYDGQATSSRVAINDARKDSSNKRLTDAAQSLALDAVRAYMDVVRYRTLVSLSEENVSTHRIILESLEERQQAGVGSIADVTQTQGRLARGLSSLAEDKRNLVSSLATYRKVVGMEAPDNMVPMDPEDLTFSGPDEIIALARQNNPRLQALMSDVRRARKNVTLESSSFMPSVDLQVSTDYTDKDGSYTEENEAKLTASWNLFNGGSDVASKRSATEQKLQSLATLSDQKRVIEEEIRHTWSRYLSDKEQIDLYTEAVYYNRQTSDSYLQQFNIGQRSLLDVLDAENETFQSSSLLVTTQADLVVAYYRVLTLCGKLLSTVEVDPNLYLNNRAKDEE